MKNLSALSLHNKSSTGTVLNSKPERHGPSNARHKHVLEPKRHDQSKARQKHVHRNSVHVPLQRTLEAQGQTHDHTCFPCHFNKKHHFRRDTTQYPDMTVAERRRFQLQHHAAHSAQRQEGYRTIYVRRFEHVLSVELSKGHWLRGVYVVVTCSKHPHKLEVCINISPPPRLLLFSCSFHCSSDPISAI